MPHGAEEALRYLRAEVKKAREQNAATLRDTGDQLAHARIDDWLRFFDRRLDVAFVIARQSNPAALSDADPFPGLRSPVPGVAMTMFEDRDP